MTTLSVLIPAYNEGRHIKKLLSRVCAVKIPKVRKEIIVIDDGSVDDTAAFVKEFKGVQLVRHSTNKGKGAAIRSGIEVAKGDIALIQDADLEYSPEEFASLLAPILEGRSRVVYGSRFMHRKGALMPKKHTGAKARFYLGGQGLSFIANVLYRKKISDLTTCYKVIDMKLLRELDLRCDGFEFCPEITAKLFKRGEKIIEVPISYSPRTVDEGKKIRMRDGLSFVQVLVKERLNP